MISTSIFNRGNRSTNSARSLKPLLKGWAEGVEKAHENGKQVAWGMLGIPTELLDVFDVEIVWPENYGPVCAAYSKTLDYMERAENEGYAKDLCAYMRNVLGYCREFSDLGYPPVDAPRNGLPYPDMFVTTTNTCDPRTKIFQALASRYMKIPTFVCDIQNPCVGVNVHDEDVKRHFISHNFQQLLGMVAFLEKVTNKKLDLDNLAKTMRTAYLTRKRFFEVHELRKAIPCPMPSEDVFACIVPQLYYPSRADALDFFNKLYDEVKYRVDNKIGVVPNEKHRLIWMGIPTWFNMGVFNYFEQRGAVFVWETTYHVSDPIEVDLSDPLRALVEGIWIRASRAHSIGGVEVCPQITAYDVRYSSAPTQLVLKLIKDYNADGVVMHRTITCRAASFGQIHIRREIARHLNIPVLQIESDMADTRLWSDARIKTEITAFLELLDKSKSY